MIGWSILLGMDEILIVVERCPDSGQLIASWDEPAGKAPGFAPSLARNFEADWPLSLVAQLLPLECNAIGASADLEN